MTEKWITRQLGFIRGKILHPWTYYVAWRILQADSFDVFCVTAAATIPANPNKQGILPVSVTKQLTDSAAIM